MNELWLTRSEWDALLKLDAAWDNISTPTAVLALQVILGPERCQAYIQAVCNRKKLEVRIIGEEERLVMPA